MEKAFDFRDYPSPEAFRDFLSQNGMYLPVDSDPGILGTPLTVGDREIANRICIQPLEGYDSGEEGEPTDLVYRRYRRFAEGGAGTVWFESAAVSEDGKSNPHQMMLREEHIPEFRSLLREMDRISQDRFGYTQYKVLQLTHSGRVSRGADWSPRPIAARRRPSDPAALVPASDAWVDGLIEKTVRHAVLAMEAGFDAVDVKACHGYFLSEMLGAFEREGEYGGSFENRTKALIRIVDGINRETGGQLALTVRLNAYEGTEGSRGWGVRREEGRLVPDPSEPALLCRMLRDRGIRIIDVSASQPRQRLYGGPCSEALQRFVNPSDMLESVRELKKRVPGVAFVCTGLSQFRQFGPAVGAGGIRDGWFDLAGFGRQALAYPGFAEAALSGRTLDPDLCCVGCSSCFRLMNPGLCAAGCVVRDPEPYARLYRENVLGRER